MTNTKEKLLEASYFLKNVKSCFRSRQHLEMQFNLNAFVNAVRSITWVMQKEFKKFDGFDVWFEKAKKKHMDEDAFKKLNNLRITSVKKKSVKPTYVQTVAFKSPVTIKPKQSLEIFTYGEGEIDATLHTDTGESIKFNESQYIVDLSCQFGEMPDVDLFDFCEQYVESSKKMVEECEEEFKRSLQR